MFGCGLLSCVKTPHRSSLRTLTETAVVYDDASLPCACARYFAGALVRVRVRVPAQSELIKLQQMLQKATKEHNKQLEAAKFLLTTQIAAAYTQSRKEIGVTAGGSGADAGPATELASRGAGGVESGGGGGPRWKGGSGEALSVSAEGWAEPFKPIGYLESCFVRKNGTPRQGGIVPHARAKLTLTCFGDSAPSVQGLAEFSHVWVRNTACMGAAPAGREQRRPHSAAHAVKSSLEDEPIPLG